MKVEDEDIERQDESVYLILFIKSCINYFKHLRKINNRNRKTATVYNY